MSREQILAEVLAERERQAAMGASAAHDDRHGVADWVMVLTRHLGLASADGLPAGDRPLSVAAPDPERFRRQMIRLAAVAVAACEAIDRGASPGAPPEPEPEALAPPAGPDYSWFQGTADRRGEPLLVLVTRVDVMQRVEQTRPYAVAEADASGWEKHNAVARYEPRREPS